MRIELLIRQMFVGSSWRWLYEDEPLYRPVPNLSTQLYGSSRQESITILKYAYIL